MHSSLFVLLFQDAGYTKKIYIRFFQQRAAQKNCKKHDIFVYFNGFFTTKFLLNAFFAVAFFPFNKKIQMNAFDVQFFPRFSSA